MRLHPLQRCTQYISFEMDNFVATYQLFVTSFKKPGIPVFYNVYRPLSLIYLWVKEREQQSRPTPKK